MTILPYKNENEYLAGKNISVFFKENQVGNILKKSNAAKEQGIPALRIFGVLLLLIFTEKGLHRFIAEKHTDNPVLYRKKGVYTSKVIRYGKA